MRAVIVLALASCVTTKPPIDDDFGGGGKADSIASSLKVLGDLDYGFETDATYSGSPRYLALRLPFSNTGAHLDAWIRSQDGDAAAWILDDSFKIVAKNDDADATTSDAHVVADTKPATHPYLVWRDVYLDAATFHIELTGLDKPGHAIAASWMFASGAPCPADHPTIVLHTERADLPNVWFEDLFDCTAMSGTSAPLAPGVYSASIALTSQDGTDTIARTPATMVDLRTGDASFAGVIQLP